MCKTAGINSLGRSFVHVNAAETAKQTKTNSKERSVMCYNSNRRMFMSHGLLSGHPPA